jgi:peptide/nickel transport system substrate-binding protein
VPSAASQARPGWPGPAGQNYLAQQLPVVWMPQFDFQISAVTDALHGVYPQDPDTNIYPENWYFVK